MTPAEAAVDTGALWLAVLQRAVGRASHDVKDAMNGVSVNLEVIRSRSGKPGAPASAVAPFADAAAQQFDRLNVLVEAVLALGRTEREPVDVGLTLRHLATVCGASSLAGDSAVEVRESGSLPSTRTSLRGEIVRLALAAPLLELVLGTERGQRAAPVICTLGGDDETIVVTLGAEGRRARMPDAVADTVRAAGIRCTESTNELSLAFPRA